jgi:hypothetical protein
VNDSYRLLYSANIPRAAEHARHYDNLTLDELCDIDKVVKHLGHGCLFSLVLGSSATRTVARHLECARS